MNNLKTFWLRHASICTIVYLFTMNLENWRFLTIYWSCAFLSSVICTYTDNLEGEKYVK